MPRPPVDQPDELLVPLVNAPDQQAPVEHAFTISTGADVTVVNVITPLDEPFSEGRVLRTTEARREAARDRARRLVESAREHAASTGERDSVVNITIAEGRPIRAVADRATARNVDRIVVDGRDRSRRSTLLFGRSVAAALADETEVPVTTVDGEA